MQIYKKISTGKKRVRANYIYYTLLTYIISILYKLIISMIEKQFKVYK